LREKTLSIKIVRRRRREENFSLKEREEGGG